MRGTMQKAHRLGYTIDQAIAAAGRAIGEAAVALAAARDPGNQGVVFVLAGPDRAAAPALEGALAVAATGRNVVVALCTGRARPSDAATATAWDRLETSASVRRFRIPSIREAAHFRAGLDAVAAIVDALGGVHPGGSLPEPIEAGLDLVRRARRAGVPCIAVDAPVGFDPESGRRRRGLPGADITLTFHRPLVGHRAAGAEAYLGEVVVVPLGLPAGADDAAR